MLPSVISTQVTLLSPLRETAGLARRAGVRYLTSHSSSTITHIEMCLFSILVVLIDLF